MDWLVIVAGCGLAVLLAVCGFVREFRLRRALERLVARLWSLVRSQNVERKK